MPPPDGGDDFVGIGLPDERAWLLVMLLDEAVGPIAASHGVVRWRLIDLAQWIWDEFALSISKQTLSRELRAMGYRKLTARPRHHAQDADAIPAFKKASPPGWRRSAPHSPAAPL